jgi:hypothetical protein
MLDPDLLVHLAKHGMEKEVGEFLHGFKQPPRFNPLSEPPITELSAEDDYIIGASLDVGVDAPLEPPIRDEYVKPRIPELTVFYRSGRKQVFVGQQAKQFLPPVEDYCKWLAIDSRERGAPPELPEALK